MLRVEGPAAPTAANTPTGGHPIAPTPGADGGYNTVTAELLLQRVPVSIMSQVMPTPGDTTAVDTFAPATSGAGALVSGSAAASFPDSVAAATAAAACQLVVGVQLPGQHEQVQLAVVDEVFAPPQLPVTGAGAGGYSGTHTGESSRG